jgi:NTP pyrophosphatase (non-canonical NTP hydrolase)
MSRQAAMKVLHDVDAERDKQQLKFGDQQHSLPTWLCILTEEVGELAEAILKDTRSDPWHHGTHSTTVREEALQVAAVAAAIVEYIDEGVA